MAQTEESGVPGLWSLFHQAVATAGEAVEDRTRHLGAMAFDDVERVGKGRRVGQRRPRGERANVSRGDVAEHQHEPTARAALRGEPPTAKPRQVFAHLIDGVDRRAAPQQGVCGGGQLFDRERRHGQRGNRRGPTADEKNREFLRPRGLDRVPKRLSRLNARPRRDRVAAEMKRQLARMG